MYQNTNNQQWPRQRDIWTADKKNIRSTTKITTPEINNEDIAPAPDIKSDDVFIVFLSVDTQGTVYNDLTG